MSHPRFNDKLRAVGALADSLRQTRAFVRERLTNLDPSFFAQISDAQLACLEQQALATRRFNAAMTALSVLPLLLLTAFRFATGVELAADPNELVAGRDTTLAMCLSFIPLVMAFQLFVPLDGGTLALRKLAMAQRQDGPRQTYNSPPARAYREQVRSHRHLRVVDVECMHELDLAYAAHQSSAVHA